jgi:hypothetical protein
MVLMQVAVFGGEGAAAAAELNLQLLTWGETLAVLVELLPAERVVRVVEADPAVLCHAAPVVRDTSERPFAFNPWGSERVESVYQEIQ